jgi:hypothetical protein
MSRRDADWIREKPVGKSSNPRSSNNSQSIASASLQQQEQGDRAARKQDGCSCWLIALTIYVPLIIYSHLYSAPSSICCALPQRSRLSIDRLSRCHHRLAYLPSFTSRCNLLLGPAASPPPSQMQHHVRRFVPIPKCGRIRATAPSCSVMNPRPQLALPFAHRRRLLLISRRLYHAACRTARLARLRPCHTLPTAPCQCHPVQRQTG